jgi:hypothetical protein
MMSPVLALDRRTAGPWGSSPRHSSAFAMTDGGVVRHGPVASSHHAGSPPRPSDRRPAAQSRPVNPHAVGLEPNDRARSGGERDRDRAATLVGERQEAGVQISGRCAVHPRFVACDGRVGTTNEVKGDPCSCLSADREQGGPEVVRRSASEDRSPRSSAHSRPSGYGSPSQPPARNAG